jgi:RNA polymerase sigma-70 factor, ECF subfamily
MKVSGVKLIRIEYEVNSVNLNGQIRFERRAADTIKLVKQILGNISDGPIEDSTRPATSFDTLFHEYWSKVCRLLERMVGDSDEAEDLAMEVFWRLFQRHPLEGEGQNLGGWIYRVATNIGYNALRSRHRRKHYESKAGLDELTSGKNQSPAQEVEKAEQRHQVRQTLAQMKPRSAKILAMRYSGLTYTEIAAALGLSPTSIGTLLARAEREFEKRYRNLERGQE